MATGARVHRRPDGYFIVMDGELLTDVGKGGVIRDGKIAEALRDVLVARYPMSTVKLFGSLRVVSR